MKLSALLETLRKLLEVLEGVGADYMLIGGLALPAYGRPRATYDIDLAISIKNPKVFRKMEEELLKRKFQLPAGLKPGAPCVYLGDLENQTNVEFWFKPDGVNFKEALKRRWRVDVAAGLKVWVIGPEDFILNKLARPDRSELDEHDVISVMELCKKLDERYLRKRAKSIGVLEVLDALRSRMKSGS
ncbi:MAG: nucleotidyltransferase [Candidatus Hadarchaeales archaeon]